MNIYLPTGCRTEDMEIGVGVEGRLVNFIKVQVIELSFFISTYNINNLTLLILSNCELSQTFVVIYSFKYTFMFDDKSKRFDPLTSFIRFRFLYV